MICSLTEETLCSLINPAQKTITDESVSQCSFPHYTDNMALSSEHTKYIYRVSQEEGTKLRESVPYVKI